MMKVSKLIAGGAAALLLGATGFLAGCDEGGMDDTDMPAPPATEDQGTGGGLNDGGTQDDGTGGAPALPETEDGGGDDAGGGLDY